MPDQLDGFPSGKEPVGLHALSWIRVSSGCDKPYRWFPSLSNLDHHFSLSFDLTISHGPGLCFLISAVILSFRFYCFFELLESITITTHSELNNSGFIFLKSWSFDVLNIASCKTVRWMALAAARSRSLPPWPWERSRIAGVTCGPTYIEEPLARNLTFLTYSLKVW